jgi:hypothetical protein
MPALLRPAVRLLLAVGIIGAGIAISAPSGQAADTSVTVSPSRGGPDDEFTVVYRWPAASGRNKHSTPRACTTDEITFKWDGSPLGRAPSTLSNGTCTATLRAAPPSGTYQGTTAHTIGVTIDASARASYTVIENTAGTPSAGTTDSATDPAAETPVTVPATPPDATGPNGAATGQGAGGGTGWLIAFGLALALAGAGALGFIVWRTRHPKPAADVPWSPVEYDTQQLPVGGRAVRPAAHRARRRFGRFPAS